MVAHNPSTERQRQVDLCEFEACLVYRASSWRARSTQRNPVSINKNKNKTKILERQSKQDDHKFPPVLYSENLSKL